MPNAAPATLVVTSTTGPGQAVNAMKFTDVNDIEIDFLRNWIRVTRAGTGGIQYYDYSAMNTISVTISGGITTITISS